METDSTPFLAQNTVETVRIVHRVRTVSTSFSSTTPRESQLPRKYNTTHKKRGIVLIFNQTHFTNGLSKRNGTNNDCKRVARMFRNTGFTTKVYQDASLSKIRATLKKVSTADHTDSDCFALLIMTHGSYNEKLNAKDAEFSAKELWEPFLGDNCKSLIGKPKLFFLQACRGEKTDDGTDDREMMVDAVDSAPRATVHSYHIPNNADLLLMFSTYKDHYSYRNPQNGSWFVQSLCAEFEQNAHTYDLMRLLTAVNQRVAFNYKSNTRDEETSNKKQMPTITSTLTRKLYFPEKETSSKKNLCGCF